MTTAVCFDLMEVIGERVVEIQETQKNRSNFTGVIGELNLIIERADEFATYNTEYFRAEDYVWDGTRMGDGEWEYAFWSHLED